MTDPRDRLEDELLVLACRGGDSGAFRALIERWQEPLWRHAFRLTGGEDAAWDVLQESWLAIARGIGALDEPGRFRAWAYRIVTRRATDRLRGRRLEEQLDGALLPAPQQEGPSDAVELLRRGLARLAPERRALLALHYTDGLELREIATALEVPEGTVKSRLYQARRELRAILERLDKETER